MPPTSLTNADIAAVLYEIAELLEFQGVKFKPRAYQRAAQSIESLGEDVGDVYARGDLEEIPGVGENIAAKIVTLIEEGELPYLADLRKELPAGMVELLEIEGIGPKKALLLHKKLGVDDVDDLEAAAKAGKIRGLAGFGETSEENLLAAIQVYRERGSRFLLGYILPDAEAIEAALAGHPAVIRACLAGSIRRRKETIGDVDVLVATDDPGTVSAFFCSLPQATRVVMTGPTKSTIVVGDNLHVDMRVVTAEQFGAALQYFTGSKSHNIALRQIAIGRGWKLSEYGLFAREGETVIAREREEDIYGALDMAYIPPELREDRGEIAAAREGTLPDLIGYGDIRGGLHVHTTWSDGANTIREMAEAALACGWEYIAVCDHSAGLPVAHGISPGEILEQAKEIEQVNRDLAGKGITVLHGIEANIDKDGLPDVPKKILRDLDVVVASVHSGFRQTGAEMTERLLAAVSHDHVDIIGHPTGRLIQRRPAYRFDMDAVFSAAAAAHVMMEINAFPTRLDLSDVHCRRARDAGVTMAIGTDAHNRDHLRFMALGVAVARRGWLEAGDVVNTRPLKELRAFLEK
ncbi:phosphotransferase [Methanomicrobiaceae archaeon CYW5]|uniref:DNA polymerase/3'-5' exonuclease PolX n=1 Tax=Methanovulcanius yangii TaxID=1789227 RepID=UPI0029CA24C3|nr:DNA polymerase/3'-5' exonuclease PolX [Methanovulcanius yangii]MBT8507576.1 phosphotransferase [Methanovulcanius yangii]